MVGKSIQAHSLRIDNVTIPFFFEYDAVNTLGKRPFVADRIDVV